MKGAEMPATAVRSVEVTMTLTAPKKHSVKFDAAPVTDGAELPALTNAYLGTAAWVALGEPERITITVTVPA